MDDADGKNIFSLISILREALLKIAEEKGKNIRSNRDEIMNLEKIIDNLKEEKRILAREKLEEADNLMRLLRTNEEKMREL